MVVSFALLEKNTWIDSDCLGSQFQKYYSKFLAEQVSGEDREFMVLE